MFNYNKLYSFEDIADMLKNFKYLKRKVLQLEFEIEHFISIASDEDIIDTMTFGKGEVTGSIHTDQMSDKTGNTAISYKDKASRLNRKVKHELEEELRLTQLDIERLEYYISILDHKLSQVLSALYFNEKTFIDAAKELGISVSTLRNLRRAGIQNLAVMFNGIFK